MTSNSGNEVEVLEYYKNKIEKYVKIAEDSGNSDDKEKVKVKINAEAVLLKALGRLDQVRVNIKLLQDTGIGRTISSLKKKYPEAQIGGQSRDLVAKWKEVVTREEQDDEQEARDSGHDSGEEATQPQLPTPSYVPTPIAKPAEYVPTPKTELTSSSSSRDKEQEKKKEKEEKRREEKELARRGEKQNCDTKEKKEERRKKDEKRKREESSKDKRTSSSTSSTSSKSSKTSDHRSKESSSSSSSSSNRSKIKSEPSDHHKSSSSSKVKKEKVEEAPPRLNGFDFLKDTEEEQQMLEREERRSKKRREKEKSEKSSSSKEDSFTSALNGLSETFKKPKRKIEEEETDEERRKKARKEEKSGGLSFPPSTRAPSYIPDISPNYKGNTSSIPDISPVYQPPPRPINSILQSEPKKPQKVAGQEVGDEETFAILLENKAKGRSAIYSGTARKGYNLVDKDGNVREVPRLYDQCMQVLKDNVDSIDETGGIPFDILEPVLEQASSKTLHYLEECNPYLVESTGKLWEKWVKKDFRSKDRDDMESYKEMYERCKMERDQKLNTLKGKVKSCYKREKEKHRETKLAYVDMAPKAPRSVKVAQVKNGTFVPTGTSLGDLKSKRTSDPTAGRNMMGSRKPKAAPMMQKTMQMIRKMRR